MADPRQEAFDAFLRERAAPPPPPEPESSGDDRQEAFDAFLQSRRPRAMGEDAYAENALGAAATNVLNAPRVKFTPGQSDNIAGKAVNRLARAGHESVFGGAFDAMGAALAYWKLKDDVPDLTYRETLRAVREGWEEAPNDLLATIGGAIVGGGAGGLAEETARGLLDETVDRTAGLGFDGSAVFDAMIGGALAGFIGGGALQFAARGVGVVPGAADVGQWLKSHFNIGEGQAELAGRKLGRILARDGENGDQLLKRLREDFQVARRETGDPAQALARAVPREQLRKVTDVIRLFSGDIDIRARELGEGMQQRAAERFLRLVQNGEAFASPGQLDAAANKMFSNMMERHGKRMVRVPDDVIDDLAGSRDWLASLKGDPAAREIVRVIDLQANIDDIRLRAGRARDAADVASARAETAGIRRTLEEMFDRAVQGKGEEGAAQTLRLVQEGGEPSIQALQRLLRYMSALDNDFAKRVSAGQRGFDADKLEEVLANMERDLAVYRRDGVRVRFEDANSVRREASAAAYSPRNSFAEGKTAEFVRDRVSQIGQAEVPEYADMVRNWSIAKTRAEAQDLGIAAMKDMDPRELAAQLRGYRANDRNIRPGPRLEAHQAGAREGALRAIEVDAARGGNAGARGYAAFPPRWRPSARAD